MGIQPWHGNDKNKLYQKFFINSEKNNKTQILKGSKLQTLIKFKGAELSQFLRMFTNINKKGS